MVLFLVLGYLYAGVVAFVAARDDINSQFRHQPRKKLAIFFGFMLLWPFLPLHLCLVD